VRFYTLAILFILAGGCSTVEPGDPCIAYEEKIIPPGHDFTQGGGRKKVKFPKNICTEQQEQG